MKIFDPQTTVAASPSPSMGDSVMHMSLLREKCVSLSVAILLALVPLLSLLLAAAPVRAEVEPKCSGMAEGAENCWKEISNQPGCYLLNDVYYPDQTVTWSGTCSGDMAVGDGILVWKREEKSDKYTGSLTDGKQNGEWTIETSDGAVLKGPYVDGKQNGEWTIETSDGAVLKGPYVDGKQNEEWTIETSNGAVLKGPYVDGKQNEEWTIDNTDSSLLCCGLASEVKKGPYVDGVKEGEWVWRQKYENGDELVRVVPMVNGKKHGEARTFRDGKCIVARTYLYNELISQEPC